MVGSNCRSENGITVSLNSERYCKISYVFNCGGAILGGIYVYLQQDGATVQTSRESMQGIRQIDLTIFIYPGRISSHLADIPWPTGPHTWVFVNCSYGDISSHKCIFCNPKYYSNWQRHYRIKWLLSNNNE